MMVVGREEAWRREQHSRVEFLRAQTQSSRARVLVRSTPPATRPACPVVALTSSQQQARAWETKTRIPKRLAVAEGWDRDEKEVINSVKLYIHVISTNIACC